MPASKAQKLHQLAELRAFTTSLRVCGVNSSMVRTANIAARELTHYPADEIGESLQRLLHVRRQVGCLGGHHMPATGSVDVNMHNPQLAADALALDDAPR